MRYFQIAFVFSLLFFCCNSATDKFSETKIKFLTDTFDFGSIKKGDSAIAIFEYQNVGNYPLKIINIAPSCGCSKPVFDTTLIPIGSSKTFQLVYNSKDDTGYTLKSMVVESNTKPRLKVLYIKGIVE